MGFNPLGVEKEIENGLGLYFLVEHSMGLNLLGERKINEFYPIDTLDYTSSAKTPLRSWFFLTLE
jgi:hypothetical protein